jgi:transcriptional regulator with XRE-family HTH domain
MLLREAIGQVLRNQRTFRGETLRSVTNRAGISYSYLSEVELGKKDISSEMLEAVCTVINMPLNELLTRAGRML